MTNLKDILSDDEKRLRIEVNKLCSKNDYYTAANHADTFLKSQPDSFYGQYLSLVLWGDYSYNPDLSIEKSKEIRQKSVNGLNKIMASASFENLPDNLKYGFTNEILYFTKQYRKQLEFGLDLIEKTGDRGHYSVCVGASCNAREMLFSGDNKDEIKEMAQLSIEYFHKYKEIRTPPENIYFFVAQAYACLGEALLQS